MTAASTRGGTVRLWRVFPWDRRALPGQAYSAASVAPRQQQGGGRFGYRGRLVGGFARISTAGFVS